MHHKFYILHFSFYILLSFLPLRAQTTLDSPVYLGSILIEEPTVETMSQTCERYGLTASSDTIGGYTAYTHRDGTIIRFKMTSAPNGRTVPLIEITTNLSAKKIGKILQETGYEKIKNGYTKGSQYANRRTVCCLRGSKPVTIIQITKVYNN